MARTEGARVDLAFLADDRRPAHASGGPAPETAPVRVVIASDVRLYREGLAGSLSQERALSVVGIASRLQEALACARDLAPDVVLLDIALPDCLELVRTLKRVAPGVKTVAFAVLDADGEILACAEAGMSGYVQRDASIGELVETLTSVVRGELLCSPRLAGALFRRVATLSAERDRNAEPPRAPLTQREREILEMIDLGLSNKQIAARLRIEMATVKNHVHHILAKLQVTRRGEAAAQARRGNGGGLR